MASVGGECAGRNRRCVAISGLDDADVDRRRNEELGARELYRSGGLGVENRPSADEHVVEPIGEGANRLRNVRRICGHFEGRDATVDHGSRYVDRGFRIHAAEDRDHAALADLIDSL